MDTLRRLYRQFRDALRPIARLFEKLWLGFLRIAQRVAPWFERLWLENRPVILIASLLVLFLAVYLLPRICIFVDAGEAAVKFRRFGGGTVVDRVYGEGIHVIFPWDHMYVYNTRVQQHAHIADLLTENGLKMRFALSFRYRPERETLGLLHQNIGPDYVDKIVVPELLSVLRTEVGRQTAEEIYTAEPGIMEQVLNRAVEDVAQSYITVNQVIVKGIELPPQVQRAIDDKIEQQHVAEAFEFRILKEQQEARRKEIEAEGFRAYNEIIAQSLTDDILRWKGIEATRDLSASENAKVIIVGNGDDGLPVILGAGAQ